MTRVSAIAKAEAYFGSGNFRSDLAPRVDMPTREPRCRLDFKTSARRCPHEPCNKRAPMREMVRFCAFAGVLFCAALPAAGLSPCVDVALVLAVDASESIDDAESCNLRAGCNSCLGQSSTTPHAMSCRSELRVYSRTSRLLPKPAARASAERCRA